MKSNRRNRKPSNTVAFPTAAKGRWNPADNTRPQVFVNRKAKADKLACRGKAWA